MGAEPTTPFAIAALPLEQARPLRQWPGMLFAIGVFAFLSIAAGITSDGFLEGDACTHYLYSRFAFAEPHLMTNVWGRPFCTLIYALPATLGLRTGVRISSAIMAIGIGLICYRIARNQGYRWPGLALIFLLGQPLLFLHSFSELTELPFALLVALALWAYQARQWFWLALVAGLMPTSRPEGFIFLGFVAGALVLHRRWWWLPVLVLPLAVWSYSGWWMFGRDPRYAWYQWLPRQWPYSAKSSYTPGSIFQFLGGLPSIVSPGAFPAVLIGIGLSLRPSSTSCNTSAFCPVTWLKSIFGPDHRLRCQWVIVGLALFVLVGHSILYSRGMWSSNGELRYMLVVSPMWALLAAMGWEWAFARLNWKAPLGWAGLAVLVPAFANAIYPVIPLRLSDESMRSRDAAEWFAKCPWPKDYTRLIATNREVYFFLDLSPSNWDKSAEYIRDTIVKDQRGINRGIIMIWDPIYGVYNSDSTRSILAHEIEAAGWVPIHIFTTPEEKTPVGMIDKMAKSVQKNKLQDWVVFLSPYDVHGNPTPRNLAVKLPTTRP